MLYNIVNPRGDDDFRRYIEAIEEAYWPQDRYRENIQRINPHYINPENLAQLNEQLLTLNTSVEGIIKDIASEELYSQFFQNGQRDQKIPFLDKFHQFFSRRRWNFVETEPRNPNPDGLNNLFRLYPADFQLNNVAVIPNYSANYGEYNHYLNVIAALARLIDYFSKPRNVKKLFEGEIGEGEIEKFYRNLAFDEGGVFPNLRTFKLMLTAFYHDIGKTVSDARHGMEGSIILGFHTSKSRYQLNEIVTDYDPNFKFERDDLLWMAEMINYHDNYGTLATGEDGYQQLVAIIDGAKRYSKTLPHSENYQLYSQRCIFDLWLLNIADIIVSIKDKYKRQNGNDSDINWMAETSARDYIEVFLGVREPDEGQYSWWDYSKKSMLVHDLKISFEMLELHNHKKHTDATSALEEKAHSYSQRHSVDRVKRLVISSLEVLIWEYCSIDSQNQKQQDKFIENFKLTHPEIKEHPEIKKIKETKDLSSVDKIESIKKIQKESIKKIQKILTKIKNISEENWDSSIVRSIESMGDMQDFCERLAWIGKMDYSLGFFRKIAKRAIDKVAEAILTGSNCPGWFEDPDPAQDFGNDPEYLAKIQAQFIADNYAAIIVQILSYLVFHEPCVEYFRNLEFRDATQRLNEEKIDKIIGLEGTYRARRSTELILKTISMY